MAVTAEHDTDETEAPRPHDVPNPIPVRVQLGIGAVAVTAAVLSFSSLRELAIATGTPEPIAWLFPITLDAAAGVAMFVWMRSLTTHVVQYARRLTSALAVTSILCNSVNHGFKAIIENPPWWKLTAVLAVGTIPPIVFVTVVHMVFLARQPEPWGGAEAVTVKPEQPAQVTIDEGSPVATDGPPRVDEASREDDADAAPLEVGEPSVARDESKTPRPVRRRCGNDTCGRLLPPGSRVDRKFCDATCRQSAARAASRDKAVTA